MGTIVLILLEDGFRDEEAIYPYYRFIEAGYDVKTVAPQKGRQYTGKFGIPLNADLSSKEVLEGKIESIGAVIIPGGYAPDRMRMDKNMVEIVRKANNSCKIIASICHGGSMLVEADIIKNRNVTSYKSIATDMENAGGKYIDREVVVDDNLITSRVPSDLPAFCKYTITMLQEYSRQK